MIICANLWTKKLSGKESRELAKQAVITKCRVKYQCGAKPCLSVPKIKIYGQKICGQKICDNPIKIIICGNLWIKTSVDESSDR